METPEPQVNITVDISDEGELMYSFHYKARPWTVNSERAGNRWTLAKTRKSGEPCSLMRLVCMNVIS